MPLPEALRPEPQELPKPSEPQSLANKARQLSIRLRPELTDFLRQEHGVSAPIEETLSRMEELARGLEDGERMIVAKPAKS